MPYPIYQYLFFSIVFLAVSGLLFCCSCLLLVAERQWVLGFTVGLPRFVERFVCRGTQSNRWVRIR